MSSVPGVLQSASAVATGVFPKYTYVSYREGRVVPNLNNTMHDGSMYHNAVAVIEGDVNPPTTLRIWSNLVVRLTPSVLASLYTFFDSHNGGLIPFKFYDPYDVVPGHAVGSNWDGTGASTQGRHYCVFTVQQWSEEITLARGNFQFSLKEVF